MTLHVRTWSWAKNGRVTDMTNAGKRGKRCRVLRFQGTDYYGDQTAQNHTHELMHVVEHLDKSETFEAAVAKVAAVVEKARAAGVTEDRLNTHEETIRGVDAPRETLIAGVEGKWSARADDGGVHLAAHDDVNEWREITPSRQSSNRAYDLAKKVWDKVKAAVTLGEASNVLRAAGCLLHGYCAMD